MGAPQCCRKLSLIKTKFRGDDDNYRGSKLFAICVFGYKWHFFCAYSCSIQNNLVPLQSQIRAIGFADIFYKSVCFI